LIGAVRECIEELKPRLPGDTDPDALATYVLAIMEGGVMLSRSYGSVEPFDRTVSQLRQHFRLLLAPETGSGKPKAAKTKKKSRRR
jgi:TetR/AcrR family transcriptional regulator, transcriptional repressor for nem operon